MPMPKQPLKTALPETPRETATDPLALERDFAWAVYDVQRLIARTFDRRMRELGLTQAQGRVLALLKREDGRTQTAIADALDMERAPLGKLVDRLEEAGFVQRGLDCDDRRVRRVFITPKFGGVAADMDEVGKHIFAGALEGISRTTLQQTTDALTHMKANLMVRDEAEPQTGSEPITTQADNKPGTAR